MALYSYRAHVLLDENHSHVNDSGMDWTHKHETAVLDKGPSPWEGMFVLPSPLAGEGLCYMAPYLNGKRVHSTSESLGCAVSTHHDKGNSILAWPAEVDMPYALGSVDTYTILDGCPSHVLNCSKGDGTVTPLTDSENG